MNDAEGANQLLELIRGETGCPYLSDLHDPIWKERILTVVERIPADMFSISAWTAVFYYIAGGQSVSGESAEEVRTALSMYLK